MLQTIEKQMTCVYCHGSLTPIEAWGNFSAETSPVLECDCCGEIFDPEMLVNNYLDVQYNGNGNEEL